MPRHSFALALASAHPEVGVFSASISPEYEVEPHPAIGLFEPYLAIRRLTADVIGKRAGPHVLPIGAGMVVRRGIAEVHAAAVEGGTGRLELDRKGDSLLAAGDTDLGYTALDKGYACGSFQALRVTHLIPARRVQSNYLFKLVEDVTYSQLLLARMRGAPGSSRARAIKQRVALIFFKLHPNRMLAGYRSALLRARLRAGTVG